MTAHLDSALYALSVVGFSIVLLSVGFVVRKRLTPHQLPLPPGPRGLPYLGNALQINKEEPWVTYGEWKKTYGELVSIKLLGQIYIVINSERVAKALLDQRSAIYSDRPVISTSAAFGLDYNTGHLNYGDTWRAHRKMLNHTLNSTVITKYHDSLAEKSRRLLADMLHSPEDFTSHMRTYATSVIMSFTYGYDVIPKDDPFVKPVEEMIHIAIQMTPEKAVLLNLFPWLLKCPSWFPGGEFKRLAERSKTLSPQVRDAPVQFVKECLAKDIENDSMVAQLLLDDTIAAGDRVEYEQKIKDAAASGFIAGTDTTQNLLVSLIMLMILHPEVQERAQALIDRVVGRERLPTFDDRSSLQYIDAIIRETLRWSSIVPMVVPHMVTQDDIFECCLIPKGAVMIPNVWGMARDEEKFPEPRAFKPERFLDADGNLTPEDTSSTMHFGFGRRICPGRFLANSSAWIAAVGMLSMFRFRKAVGPAGYEIDIIPKFVGGVALRPVPFAYRITPRFEGAKELVE